MYREQLPEEVRASVMQSVSTCLCNDGQFLNLNPQYLMDMLMRVDAHAGFIVAVQAYKSAPLPASGGGRGGGGAGCRRDVAVGLAVLDWVPGRRRPVMHIQVICGCANFDATDRLFQLAYAECRARGATSVNLDSLPHVCFYYFRYRGFHFDDTRLELHMKNFSKWYIAAAAHTQRQVKQYLSNNRLRPNAPAVARSRALETFATASGLGDELEEGQRLYCRFLRAAAPKIADMDTVLRHLSHTPVGMWGEVPPATPQPQPQPPPPHGLRRARSARVRTC
jgi:hypothetical protein